MTTAIRPAAPADLDQIADLLVQDAQERHAADPQIWQLTKDPKAKVLEALKTAFESEKPPFRQQWLVAETGSRIIDDYFHQDFADPDKLADGTTAAALLKAAGSALHTRSNSAALVVCPAAWTSKIALLESAGYRNALTWFIKR